MVGRGQFWWNSARHDEVRSEVWCDAACLGAVRRCSARRGKVSGKELLGQTRLVRMRQGQRPGMARLGTA